MRDKQTFIHTAGVQNGLATLKNKLATDSNKVKNTYNTSQKFHFRYLSKSNEGLFTQNPVSNYLEQHYS